MNFEYEVYINLLYLPFSWDKMFFPLSNLSALFLQMMKRGEYDAGVDWFSFGVCVFQMMTALSAIEKWRIEEPDIALDTLSKDFIKKVSVVTDTGHSYHLPENVLC